VRVLETAASPAYNTSRCPAVLRGVAVAPMASSSRIGIIASIARPISAVLVAGGVLVAATLTPEPGDGDRRVDVVPNATDRRVDVIVDARLFTTYHYASTLKKPVLHPIRSADGRQVTRGYPLAPRPGERADHPHHVGHWFNFGDVNGFDFWGYSDETPAANLPRMGTIGHTGIVRAEGGTDAGVLEVMADWVAASGEVRLAERTRFTFSGDGAERVIERVTTWTATNGDVTFGDTKEGAFGIRVARALEHPSAEPATFVSASGEQETVPVLDNSGVAGEYLASDGTTGEAVWGTRGPWMALRGDLEGAPVTLAIFDHPSNHGHPTRWHARGYGLFAANPFGQHAFDADVPATSFVLDDGASLTFRHQIVVWDGRLDVQAVQRAYRTFADSAP
jgi:hypothetical protein